MTLMSQSKHSRQWWHWRHRTKIRDSSDTDVTKQRLVKVVTLMSQTKNSWQWWHWCHREKTRDSGDTHVTEQKNSWHWWHWRHTTKIREIWHWCHRAKVREGGDTDVTEQNFVTVVTLMSQSKDSWQWWQWRFSSYALEGKLIPDCRNVLCLAAEYELRPGRSVLRSLTTLVGYPECQNYDCSLSTDLYGLGEVCIQRLVGKPERQGQLGRDSCLMLTKMLEKEYGWVWIETIWSG